jgi:PEP-CTERM motif
LKVFLTPMQSLTNSLGSRSHTQVLTAGITLNEFEFPHHSGVNVVVDDGGPLTIAFATLQDTGSGFFTYATPLTLTAFDAFNNILASTTASFQANLALSGDLGSTPNELLSVASASGIARVTIAGDVAGSSFTLDDLSFTPVTSPAPVPEPATLLLLLSGLAGLFGWRSVRRCTIGNRL